jgi:hypothetical protein
MIKYARARSIVALAIALVAALSFAGTLRPSSNAEAFSGVSISVQSPMFAGNSETVPITVVVTGGPAADLGGNYSYEEVKLTGANNTGWKADPATQTKESGVFRINLTMPGEPGQTVTVSLKATSTAWRTNDEAYTTTEFKIKVVEPIVINATVFNRGAVDAVNVTAEIYADGELLDTRIINVTAGTSVTISHNWTFTSIRDGKHVVTVKIDDPNHLVEFSDGNNEYSLTIYVGDQGNPAGIILSVGLIIVIVLFVLTYLQKPVKRGKKL